MTSSPNKTRADDEAVLELLAFRRQGFTAGQIKTMTGRTRHSIRSVTNRVRAADQAESNEDVSRAYW